MNNTHQYWVYILGNYHRNVLYVGITNDLYRRFKEHRDGVVDGFTKKYHCHALLYYEEFQYVEEAIAREKELKAFRREKKDIVIKRQNPDLKDLAIALGWI